MTVKYIASVCPIKSDHSKEVHFSRYTHLISSAEFCFDGYNVTSPLSVTAFGTPVDDTQFYTSAFALNNLRRRDCLQQQVGTWVKYVCWI